MPRATTSRRGLAPEQVVPEGFRRQAGPHGFQSFDDRRTPAQGIAELGRPQLAGRHATGTRLTGTQRTGTRLTGTRLTGTLSAPRRLPG